MTWAASCQNQQNGLVSSEDSDQPWHPPRLIRVFDVRMKKPWVLSYQMSAQRRLCSDWVDAQADLSLCLAHSHIVGFVMRWLTCVASEDFYQNVPPYSLIWVFAEQDKLLYTDRKDSDLIAWKHMSHVMRKPVLVICEQQRCRSACTSVQSVQHLCFPLLR